MMESKNEFYFLKNVKDDKNKKSKFDKVFQQKIISRSSTVVKKDTSYKERFLKNNLKVLKRQKTQPKEPCKAKLLKLPNSFSTLSSPGLKLVDLRKLKSNGGLKNNVIFKLDCKATGCLKKVNIEDYCSDSSKESPATKSLRKFLNSGTYTNNEASTSRTNKNFKKLPPTKIDNKKNLNDIFTTPGLFLIT